MSDRSILASALALLLTGVVVLGAAAPAASASTNAMRVGVRVPVHAGRTSVRPPPIRAPHIGRTGGSGTDGQAAASADIQVTYFGFSAQAQQAFEAAAVVWEGLISSSQVIYVDAYWENLGGGGILGSAGPEWIYREGTRWYAGPIAEARCACAKNPNGDADISASFNSSFGAWYLGTDGNPPLNDYDFYTVVLHELGHGLGFLGSFAVQSGLGYWGIVSNGTRYPMSFDEHQVTAASGGNPLISYANASSAISAYELQRRKGAGAWVAVQLSSPTSTEVDVAVTPGSKWSFRVRAIDGANNVGAWSSTTARKLVLHQESSTSVVYSGTWRRSAVSGSSAGYVRQTAVAGRYARFVFAGTSAAWMTTLAPGRGIAEIWLDGALVATVDLYSPAIIQQAVAWGSGPLAAGPHTLDVVVIGTRNPSATKNRIDIDGFLAWP